MFHIIEERVASHGTKKGKMTCTTCKLKKCIGRCHFERVTTPKAA
jgi:hypothetical protein